MLTIEDTKNAYLFLELINQFDFVRSIKFKKTKINKISERKEFSEEFSDNFFLDNLQMTVKELRLQTLQDEKEPGMTKQEFFKSMKIWRQTIEK